MHQSLAAPTGHQCLIGRKRDELIAQMLGHTRAIQRCQRPRGHQAPRLCPRIGHRDRTLRRQQIGMAGRHIQRARWPFSGYRGGQRMRAADRHGEGARQGQDEDLIHLAITVDRRPRLKPVDAKRFQALKPGHALVDVHRAGAGADAWQVDHAAVIRRDDLHGVTRIAAGVRGDPGSALRTVSGQDRGFRQRHQPAAPRPSDRESRSRRRPR